MDINFLISLVIAFITFSIGLSVNIKEFKAVLKQPKALITGLILQMLMLPLLALLISYFAPISNEWKAGIFILSICPGGTMSNFISYIVKANVALSISLTIINSIIILFSIPILTKIAISFYDISVINLSFSIQEIFIQILLLMIIPSILGVFFNYFFPVLFKKIDTFLKVVNTLLLALVFAVKIFAGEASGGNGIVFSDFVQLLPYLLLLNFGAILISYNIAKMKSLSKPDVITISIETGMQNTALALLITETILINNEISKPILVYASFTFFTSILFAFIESKKMN